ncbi:hypothetical protein EYF80_003016 [Liparis tanakae]|uniref:Uncharacterized protein n=1 Tax=Liparis tanakae TaxID=230148 RepID=A0A4Z2JAQ9_9TELE|nr:hypothetical protein EYF80_003016 [Liparis tanakae]
MPTTPANVLVCSYMPGGRLYQTPPEIDRSGHRGAFSAAAIHMSSWPAAQDRRRRQCCAGADQAAAPASIPMGSPL